MKKLIPVSLTAFIAALLLFSCSKERSVENGSMGIPATGTIQKDSQNNCKAPVIGGTYYSSQALGDSNYVQIQVNVTKVGSYKISTDNQNGFAFSDSGYFGTTGAQTIKLKGKGTPVLPNPTDFTVTFDSSSCAFTIDVKNGGNINPNNADTAWQFKDANGSYHGTIDTAYFEDSTIGTNPPYRTLMIGGATAATHDSIIQLGVAFPDTTVQTGTYLFSKSSAGFIFINKQGAQQGQIIYNAWPDSANPNPGADLTVQITSYNSSTRVVTGTFSGTGITPSTNTKVPFTNGKFTAKVQ